MHRPALENSGEEAGDGPTDEKAGDSIEGILEIRIVGREDAAIQKENAEFGAAGTEGVDGFKNVEGSGGADGVLRTDTKDVLAHAVMCAYKSIISTKPHHGAMIDCRQGSRLTEKQGNEHAIRKH